MCQTPIGEIILTEDETNYIQRVYYEKTGFQSNLNTVVAANDPSTLENNGVYDRLVQDSIQAHMEYSLVISELSDRFLEDHPEYKSAQSQINVQVDFSRQVAIFSLAGQTCSREGGCSHA